MRNLTPNVADRLRQIIGGIVLVIGVGTLFVSPLPARYALTYALIGAVCGALWSSSDEILAYAGGAVFVLGVPYAADKAPNTIPWWQPILVAASAVVFVYFLVTFVRQARNRLTDSPH